MLITCINIPYGSVNILSRILFKSPDLLKDPSRSGNNSGEIGLVLSDCFYFPTGFMSLPIGEILCFDAKSVQTRSS